MTVLVKFFRTTAFKLSALYLLLFVLFAGFIIGYVAWSTRQVINTQISTAIDAEVRELSEQYRFGGIRRLSVIVDRRSREPNASLYLVTTFSGEYLVGNVNTAPLDILAQPGMHEISYDSGEGVETKTSKALAHVSLLPGGFRLMIGRDLAERERFNEIIEEALVLSLGLVTLLACIGGWFITRRILKRVDQITETTRTIMAGDLGERIAISGNSDELDRLALNLNAMLERIGELMAAMKEVSDNIAHDLKTPLTRLRNRAEAVLRTAKTSHEYTDALEGIIEDSDNLIRVFNALLTIARLEAGNATSAIAPFDVAETVRSVAELYEALADEGHALITLDIVPGLTFLINGNRELIGQALANLLDNALKYGQPEGFAQAHIIMSAHPVIQEDGRKMVSISVADNGSGIPEHERSRVLERFARLESSRTKPGFGLGLSLVSAVVRMHGGCVILEDNLPGLRVQILLPLLQG